MPSLDTLRGRISVSEEQLELLRLCDNGELTNQGATTLPLVEAGLIDADGAVHPLVGDLAATITRPVLELWVETSTAQRRTVSHVVVRADEDLWYIDPSPEGGDATEVVFVKDGLPQLLPIVARLVGFRPSVPPEQARPITAPAAPVASVLAAFSAETGGSWDDVRTVAIARLDDVLGVMSPEQRELWIAVLATLENSRRITCTWGPETKHTRRLAVWDCGAGGFWVLSPPAEPAEESGPDAEATLVPTSSDDLWKALGQLLPAKAEVTGDASTDGARPGEWAASEGFSDWVGILQARAMSDLPLLDRKAELVAQGICVLAEYHRTGSAAEAAALQAHHGPGERADWLRRGVEAVDSLHLGSRRTLHTPVEATSWWRTQGFATAPDAVADQR